MIKSILTIAAVLSLSAAQAQIQLDKADMPFPTSNVVVNNHTAASAGVVAPVIGQNQAWDYTSLSGGSVISSSFIPNSNSGFSKTYMVDTGAIQVLTSSLSIVSNKVYGEDINGLYWFGNYTNHQVFHIGKATGTPTDSVYVPDQINALSTQETILSFPSTYKNYWDNTYSDSSSFFLTIKLAGLKNAPAYGKIYVTQRDSIAGWGTLKIPSPNKQSIAYPVVLIKRRMTRIDSFFVNNKPASALLLAGLGEMQGQVTNNYSEYFYTANRFNPMMTIDYGTDSKYATPSNVAYSADSVKSGIAVYEPTITNFNLYPNPSVNTTINCEFKKASIAPWTLTVMNTLGQTIKSQNIVGAGKMNVQIEPSVLKTDGIYFVNIIDENGNLAASGKVNMIK